MPLGNVSFLRYNQTAKNQNLSSIEITFEDGNEVLLSIHWNLWLEEEIRGRGWIELEQADVTQDTALLG